MVNNIKNKRESCDPLSVNPEVLLSVKESLQKVVADLQKLLVSSADPATTEIINSSLLNCAHALGSISRVIGGAEGELSSPGFTEEIRPMSLAQLCSDLAERFSERLQGKPELSLSFHLDPTLPSVLKGDPRQFMGMIGGLIESSVAYCSAGQIEVQMSPVASDADRGARTCSVQISCTEPAIEGGIDRLAALSCQINEVTPDGMGVGFAARIARNLAGELSVERGAEQRVRVGVTLSLPIVAAPIGFGEFPNLFRYFSKVPSTAAVLESAGKYHHVTPLPMRVPIPEGGRDTVFIDATVVMSGKFGEFEDFKPKERFVLVLDHGQLRTRERLVRAGFRRFLTLPLVSTDILRCLAGEDVVVPEMPEMRSASDAAPLKILVVDDVPTARFRVVEHLRGLGHEVTEGGDGLDLVERVKSGKKFDFIFTDLMMTHLDGGDAARQVRELEKQSGHRSTIVAMTAYTHESDRSLADPSFDAMLRKPIYLDELDYLLSKSKGPELARVAPAAKGGETTIIDLADLSARSGGKKRLMAAVLQSFMETASVKLTELHRGRESGAVPLLLKQMHALKGLCLEVGAVGVAHAAQSLEEHLKQGIVPDPAQIDELVSAVAGACKEARTIAQGLKAE